jgi:hypothetical protein
MSATLEQFNPSANGAGKLGTEERQWGQGWFTALYVNGSAVAPLASPAFTGAPSAPTANPGTNSTQLATTGFVAAASALDRARANHTGSQPAATISDFTAAVAATPSGTKAHDQGTDTGLASGTGNAVTAAALRTHLDDDSKHRVINNSGTGATDLWSASKIIAELSAVAAGEPAPHGHELDQIDGAGALAALDAVNTGQITDAAVTAVKVAGGTADPGPSKYWGTDSLNQFGFHTAPGTPKASTASGEGLLSATGGLHVVLGTANNRAASGADARFPTAGEKAALAGQTGTPGADNKFLTADWAAAFPLETAAIVTGTATTPGSVTAAQLKLAVETHIPATGGVNFDSAKGSSITAASTINLGATTGNTVDVTGSSAISALGTVAAGVVRSVRFTGSPILVYNATSLILPGLSNILVDPGDTGIFQSLGSGNWVCMSFNKAKIAPTCRGPIEVTSLSAETTIYGRVTGHLLVCGEDTYTVSIATQTASATANEPWPPNAMFWIMATFGSSIFLGGSGITLYNGSGSSGSIELTAGKVYGVFRESINVWRVISTN